MIESKDEIDLNEVLVETHGGEIPFSIGYLARSLLAAGLSEENAYKDASGIAIIIQSQGKNLYTSDEIMEITEKWYEEMNTLIAQRIRVMRRDLEPIKPMVVLLGGGSQVLVKVL